MKKTKEELIDELTNIKLDEMIESFGMDYYWSRPDECYESCRSKAEYEVGIGVYPPKK